VSLAVREGEEGAGDRVVDASNALALRRDDDATGYASVVVPVGGAGEETFLAGTAVWAAQRFGAGNGVVEVSPGVWAVNVIGEPISRDDEFVGGALELYGAGRRWAIIGSSP